MLKIHKDFSAGDAFSLSKQGGNLCQSFKKNECEAEVSLKRQN